MTKRFTKNFSFGSVAAETDPLLESGYWDNGDYSAIADPKDPNYFVIGRTGSGKSAAFRYLELNKHGKVIRIKPENLSLPYVSNLNLIRKLYEMNVHLELFFKSLWKHVIVVEVIRHRYKLTSPEQKQHIFTQLLERFKKDPGKQKALLYLEEFGDKFWCEADERVKQITENFEKKINASGNLNVDNLGVSGGASAGAEQRHTSEIQKEYIERYQRVVNETQLPRLNEVVVAMNDEILGSEQHSTYLIIDDLDKEWIDEALANIMIKCLFEAVLDMSSVKYLKILVALRTNIFQQLNYGDQKRGGQEEKFRGSSIHITWSEKDIRALLEHRAEVACKHYNLEMKSFAEMMPNYSGKQKSEDPIQFILDRTLMRPRDAIQFLNACFKHASNSSRVTWDNIRAAEKSYSEERLLSLRDEWKDPYEEIDTILRKFTGHHYQFKKKELAEVLDEVAILAEDPNFRGKEWLAPISNKIFSPDIDNMTWENIYGDIVEILYRIGFIGIARTANMKVKYSYQESGFVYQMPEISDEPLFEVHKAFRRGLGLIEHY